MALRRMDFDPCRSHHFSTVSRARKAFRQVKVGQAVPPAKGARISSRLNPSGTGRGRLAAWTMVDPPGTTQAINRFLARRLLLEKIEGEILGRKTKAQSAREDPPPRNAAAPAAPKKRCSPTEPFQSRKKQNRQAPGSWD